MQQNLLGFEVGEALFWFSCQRLNSKQFFFSSGPSLVGVRPQACAPKPEGFCFCHRHRSSPSRSPRGVSTTCDVEPLHLGNPVLKPLPRVKASTYTSYPALRLRSSLAPLEPGWDWRNKQPRHLLAVPPPCMVSARDGWSGLD